MGYNLVFVSKICKIFCRKNFFLERLGRLFAVCHGSVPKHQTRSNRLYPESPCIRMKNSCPGWCRIRKFEWQTTWKPRHFRQKHKTEVCCSFCWSPKYIAAKRQTQQDILWLGSETKNIQGWPMGNAHRLTKTARSTDRQYEKPFLVVKCFLLWPQRYNERWKPHQKQYTLISWRTS